jgi:predicted nucleic acid-binding protein
MAVDASVAFKWLLEEEGSEEAIHHAAETTLIAPTLIWAEVGNALWKKVRRGEIDSAAARLAFGSLASFIGQWHDLEGLAEPAFDLAIELGHPIYDCYYLALAETYDVELLTADLRLIESCRNTRFDVRLRRL